MRLSSLFGPAAAELVYLLLLWPSFKCVAPAQGLNFNPVPPPPLDLSQLGRVALTGDFDAISLYSYQQQTENLFSTNGSQSLITQQPNGAFATTVTSDGYIKSMCPFIMDDGTLAGVVVGGNFTSLGGQEAQGVAMFDPSTQKVTPLPGLTGNVQVLWCDQQTNTVYVGGNFKGGNSTNAIGWVGMAGWSDLPFAGFNGPVNEIKGAPNGDIIFAGSFTGLGNTTTPKRKDQQVINISSANITSGPNSSTNGFNDPRNIVCKTSGQDGAGSTWLLADDTPGFWRADFNFGFEPTKLRLWNTNQKGRGTETFRFTAFPINGIMNLTYTDPATGKKAFCDALCPLPQKSNTPYTDFHFFNNVGMNAFQIDISAWHGKGGGLDGIELFQDDIYTYAVSSLNEPACADISFPSNATSTGPWTITPSRQSNSEYLTTKLTGTNEDNVSVIFRPDIQQEGNYSVEIFTPGCIQDSSCDTRGIANVTGDFSTKTKLGQAQWTPIYQTNNYDKYDQVYFGPVDAGSGSFRPTVTLAPAPNQKNGISLVAQRVKFTLLTGTNSSDSLNGLFEFNPNQATIDTDFSNSTIDQAGLSLAAGAMINGLAILNAVTYAAGNLTGPGIVNIFSINDTNATALPGGGLNEEVSTLFAFEDLLFAAGNFTATVNKTVPGLNGIAVFNSTSQGWQAVGNGVRGRVDTVVPLDLNITTNTPETCIAFSGVFDQIEAFGSAPAIAVSGFAVWVPSQQDWQQNLVTQSMAVDGFLSASTNVTGSTPLLSGTLTSQDINAGDCISLNSNPLRINSLGVKIQPDQPGSPSKTKRAVAGVSGQNVTGAVTGLFYNSGDTNITVLGGHFTATSSNGSSISNLIFLNSTGTITGVESGLNPDTVFLALATQASTLYAGGTVSGKVNNAPVNGLITYDLVAANYANPQPPSLGGNNVAVNAIITRPNSDQIYVGGSFETAGSLGCPAVCIFENQRWNQPGTNLKGSVAAFAWQGSKKLLAGGNLTVDSSATSLAIYDTKVSKWTVMDGAASNVPGPVTALSPANNDASQFWVAGKSTNGSAFLVKYDGSNFNSVGDDLGPQTIIRGLSMFEVSQKHDSNKLVDSGMVLLVTGQLDLPNFGNASAALFNGTNFTPFLLSTSGNNPGSISQLFSEKVLSFPTSGGHMAVGLVVLIALACALGTIFLIVVAGILFERYRRKHEGYSPAPTAYFDKTSNMGRIPPEHLFGRLADRGAPQL